MKILLILFMCSITFGYYNYRGNYGYGYNNYYNGYYQPVYQPIIYVPQYDYEQDKWTTFRMENYRNEQYRNELLQNLILKKSLETKQNKIIVQNIYNTIITNHHILVVTNNIVVTNIVTKTNGEKNADL